MWKIIIAGFAAAVLVTPATAQDQQKNITLQLDAQQIQIIWAGLQELPGKIADPVKNAVQAQLKAQLDTPPQKDDKK